MNRTLLAIAANLEALNVRASAAIIVCSAAMPADAAKKAKAKPKPPAIPCTSDAQTLQRMQGKRTNAFVTRVANAASRNPDCGVISALFDEALEPGNSLSSIAAKDVLVSRHGYQVCATHHELSLIGRLQSTPDGLRLTPEGRIWAMSDSFSLLALPAAARDSLQAVGKRQSDTESPVSQ